MPGWRRASLRRRDTDFERREIRTDGTKTLARDRIVRVAEWALPSDSKCYGGSPSNQGFGY